MFILRLPPQLFDDISSDLTVQSVREQMTMAQKIKLKKGTRKKYVHS